MSPNAGRTGILAAVRDALEGRRPEPHPGTLAGAHPDPFGNPRVRLLAFTRRFLAAGGEVFVLRTRAEARVWLQDLVAGLGPAAVAPDVPGHLVPRTGGGSPPAEAPLGISLARGAVAETGSLVLDARGDRRVQLLPPVHLIWVLEDTLHGTLAEALARTGADPTAALALHSGPSKSADIGQILVQGVHGPGRVLAAVLQER